MFISNGADIRSIISCTIVTGFRVAGRHIVADDEINQLGGDNTDI